MSAPQDTRVSPAGWFPCPSPSRCRRSGSSPARAPSCTWARPRKEKERNCLEVAPRSPAAGAIARVDGVPGLNGRGWYFPPTSQEGLCRIPSLLPGTQGLWERPSSSPSHLVTPSLPSRACTHAVPAHGHLSREASQGNLPPVLPPPGSRCLVLGPVPSILTPGAMAPSSPRHQL